MHVLFSLKMRPLSSLYHDGKRLENGVLVNKSEQHIEVKDMLNVKDVKNKWEIWLIITNAINLSDEGIT